MRTAITIMCLSLVALIGAAALAAGVDPIVGERQADMKAMSAAAKSLSEIFAGKKPYDPGAFKAEAHLIASLGGERLLGHFSSVTTADGSQARAEIAIEHDKFDKFARDLSAYAAQVEAAAKDDAKMPDSMRMRPAEMTEGGPFARKKAGAPDVAAYSAEHAFHMMLQTCASCHAAFRLKR